MRPAQGARPVPSPLCCPKCNGKKLAICDNDCGTYYCSDNCCKNEWYVQKVAAWNDTRKQGTGHAPWCGEEGFSVVE